MGWQWGVFTVQSWGPQFRFQPPSMPPDMSHITDQQHQGGESRCIPEMCGNLAGLWKPVPDSSRDLASKNRQKMIKLRHLMDALLGSPNSHMYKHLNMLHIYTDAWTISTDLKAGIRGNENDGLSRRQQLLKKDTTRRSVMKGTKAEIKIPWES